MSVNNNICALLATSIVAGTAGAGVLTMTANNPIGTDGWSELTGYQMELTIDCSTMDDIGSSSVFSLTSWNFVAKDSFGTVKFSASGSGQVFTTAPGAGKFVATIGLAPSNILENHMVPQADSISFGYTYFGDESLNAAITASAGTTDGFLQLASNTGDTGILAGSYAVPAPGAITLLGLASLVGRRRRA